VVGQPVGAIPIHAVGKFWRVLGPLSLP
jgi:hypothetical protein